jgi:uncharacterized protein
MSATLQDLAVRHSDGLALKLRVAPNAKRDEIVGARTWGAEMRLVLRVRAPAECGEANASVTRLLARWLDLAPRDVRLASGERSRLKTVVATGEPDALSRRLAERLDRL